MTRIFSTLFLDHPAAVQESYAEHLRMALWFAGKLGQAACAAVIHALIPGLCKRTASEIIIELHAHMMRRR